MKRSRTTIALLAAIALLFTAVSAMAADKATKEECEAKVKAAIQSVNDIGWEQTLKIIQDPAGPYVWKDTYIFAITTTNGTVVANPINPKHVGKSLMAVKDVGGKLFFVEFINVAKNEGSGWVDYQWPKPGEKKPSRKDTFVMKVPGQDAFFGAGVYVE